MQNKIKSLSEIEGVLKQFRSANSKIVQCHGVFDLLHPGHIRHFKEAKRQGDILVVSITPDRFVNKGPGRPAFNEQLRLESIAALACVDFVVLNETPDAVAAIQTIQPSIYMKGIEYKNHKTDITGKITEEVRTIEQCGGEVHYSDELVFSSSSLINRHVDLISKETSQFLEKIKNEFTTSQLINCVESFSDLKVLIVGDAIIDEYQYVQPLGQSGKGQHLTARCLNNEVFLGGSLIIANHIAQFSKNVTVLTSIGKTCPHLNFIHTTLDPKVRTNFIYLENTQTLTKKRYVLKDGDNLSKLFETYSTNDLLLNNDQTDTLISFLEKKAKNYDLVLVCDFGNGFTNPQIVNALSNVPNFLALNTQTNSGNRGFNVVTHYNRADFISLNEPELRLAAQDRHSSLEGITSDIATLMNAKAISITRGVQGAYCLENNQHAFSIPALVSSSIDRVGAGDSYLALASLCMTKGYPLLLASFLGSIASAIDVQIIGNKEPIKKNGFLKFLTRLLK